MFQRKPIFTHLDRVRLRRLVADPATRYAWPTFVDALERKLNAGRIVEPHEVPGDVVTMHSLVKLRHRDEFAARLFLLVYPEEADLRLGRLSVLSQVGTAILGVRAGAPLRWPGETQVSPIRLERVVSQPEAKFACVMCDQRAAPVGPSACWVPRFSMS